MPKALALVADNLHRIVIEARPTPADWRAVIAFLTEIGQATDDRRQEWVLLSDLLGLTALVEEINSRRPKGATPNTVRGPFYRPDAPRMKNGGTISLDGKGEELRVRCHVVDLDGLPIVGATVETWQANAEGLYENQQPDLQPDLNLRGVFTTDGCGAIHYRTVKPAGYRVPDDGPVGTLLDGIGYPMTRPAHLHFIIRADGFESISTHVYQDRDPYLDEDAIFGVKPELVGAFRRTVDETGQAVWSLDFTFVMVRARQQRRVA